jgi:hypothetical protein
LSYLPGSFNSIQFGETDVQHNQVWLQLSRFLDSFETILHFADDLKIWTLLEQLARLASPAFVIINYENANHICLKIQAPANLAWSVFPPADRGTRTSISVPDPSPDVIEIVPFTSLTRSCMLMSPSP